MLLCFTVIHRSRLIINPNPPPVAVLLQGALQSVKMANAVASYDQLAHQVEALRKENSHLRRELEDNSNHLSKLETETSGMKVQQLQPRQHLHNHHHNDDNVLTYIHIYLYYVFLPQCE